jgi:hypothetical protein
LGHITTTAIDGQIRFRSIFSKYLEIGDTDINSFIHSIPSKFDSAVKAINNAHLPSFDETLSSNRRKLRYAIYDFHQKSGTLTSKVKSQIELIENEKLKIIVAIHQPNLFAFSGVFKKIVMLETLSNHLEKSNYAPLPLFLIIDHDFMDDSWVHVAKLPSMKNSSGILDIRYPMNDVKRWKIICKTDPPTHSLVSYWENQVYTWIKNDKSLSKENRKRLYNNLEKFWQIVEQSLSNSENYSEFNSHIMAKMINNVWDYKTLFVNLSDLSNVFKNGYNFLLSNNDVYLKSLERSETFFRNHGIHNGISSNSSKYSPLWLNCSCGSKGYSILNRDDNGNTNLTGKCISCKKDLILNVGTKNNISIPMEKLSIVSPRAIPILLLLSRELKISSYLTGTGGSLGYTIIGKRVYDDLKIKRPLLLLWASKDVYTGFAQEEALRVLRENNINDISKFLIDANNKNHDFENKIKPLISKRNLVYKDKDVLKNLLNDLLYYKKEQRNLKSLINNVEKSNNALTLKSCIIDYVVNFGMDSISQMWSSSLIKNNDFASPLILNPNKSYETN